MKIKWIAGVVLAFTMLFSMIIFSVILMNDDDSNSGSAGTGGTLSGNALLIYQFYNAKGLDDLHIAAILGNLYQESKLDPALIESNGEGIGLCQWSFGRKTQFLAYCCSAQGVKWTDIQTQLKFSWFEYDLEASQNCDDVAEYQWIYKDHRSKDAFESATTIEDATTVFCHGFERCSTSESLSKLESVRIPKAKEYYEMMQSGGSGSVAPGEASTIDTSERMKWLFPEGVPTSQSGMSQYLVTIQVPIIDSNGAKTTVPLTCHKKLANELMAIFQEMQAAGFKINYASAYAFRHMASGTGSLSHHSYGVAIDINPDANPAVYWGYAPDPSSPYYINAAIVQIWKRHGFYWGGDWSTAYFDPMHFSYTNH